ncbi:MAG: S9 family peptidase [Myxococcales bacterium]|nr:S9 family peptidase [Myxococcales bacterium]
MRFTGANGDPVQMWVLTPPSFDPKKKYPLVHLIHGGPYGTFGDVFHFRWSAQVIAGLGYVVALVNFHGSASFGEAFSRSILADWGGKPKDDILLATDHLIARGFVDPERMAIAGGSYGGYLTAWLATQTSRFRCAIAHAAVYNLGTLWASDVTQGTDLEFGGMPWGSGADLARIDAHDPARHSAGYATPMLVIHGDPRLPRARQPRPRALRGAQGQGGGGAPRPLPRREPLDPQAAELAPLVRRVHRLAAPLARLAGRGTSKKWPPG